MDNCDMTKLIELIRTRPAVWDVKSNDYSIKIKKKECWTEILRNMMVDFDDLPEYMKEYKSKDIKRKWKSLRNSFTRELGKQKIEKSGVGSSMRKKYVYFDLLTFLIPSLTEKRIIPRHPEDKETEEEEEDEEQTSETGKPQPFSYQKRKKTKRTDVLQDLNKTLQESLSHERRQQLKETVLEDEDKLFLLSLYKDLKSISPERKLMAKSELIEVLNRYNDFDSFSIHAAFLAPSHPSTFHRNSILTDDHSFGYHSYYQPVIRNENARSVNRSQKRISRKSVSSPSDSINDSEGSSISKMFMKRL